jgi:deoxycytidylate deaminase
MANYTLLNRVVEFAATNSDDPSTKVGACVSIGNREVFGTNRFINLPEGVTKEMALATRELKYQYITHAEVDAITLSGDCKGATLYVNYTPCDKCALVIAAAGISKVVAVKPTDPTLIERWSKYWIIGQAALAEAGVTYSEE